MYKVLQKGDIRTLYRVHRAKTDTYEYYQSVNGEDKQITEEQYKYLRKENHGDRKCMD